MGFSIFVWGIFAIMMIFDGLSTILFRSISHFLDKKSSYIIGILVLLILLSLYLPISPEFWNTWNKTVFTLISSASINYQTIFREVWFTFVFFSKVWPAVVLAVLVLSIKKANHPITYRYRMIKNFGHAKMLIMVAALFTFMILNQFSLLSTLKMMALNVAIYTGVFYLRFGFAIILYLSKRASIPYELMYFLMIASPILLGEHFMIPLFLCVGVGITDIWMDYYQRDASAMLFELDLN
ncbi:MAG: hypothetical protein ACRCS8_00430 [Brevinema sp.]